MVKTHHAGPILAWHGLTTFVILAAAVLMAAQGYDAVETVSVIGATGVAARMTAGASLTTTHRI
jgi:hypothetical protein